MGYGVSQFFSRHKRLVYHWSWNAFVLAGLMVLACGRYPLTKPATFSEPALIESNKKLTLALFGTPWSAETQSALPALQAEIDKLPEAARRALDVVLYVPTGGTAAIAPTQAEADRLLSVLGIKGRAVADEWRWKNFRKWVGGAFNLPAAAVVDLEGNALKVFRAGPTSFVPQEIAAYTESVIPQGNQVTLALFGAPWCSECKTDMPAIQAELDKLTKLQRAFIDVVLYVTTSGNPSVAATPEVAEQYMHAVHIKGKALADEWRWKNFRKMVGGAFLLPGAAVLNSSGEVLRSYRAGPTTFVPSEIVANALKLTQ